MAQKVTVELVDDIDGSPGHETVQFGMDGTSYEIDLSEDNAERLRLSLADYASAGRKQQATNGGGGKKRPGGKATPPKSGKSSTELASVRDWAKRNGFSVNDRGRVAQEILDAYDKHVSQIR